MTADQKKLVSRILMISAIVILGVNLVLYTRGRGQPTLLAVGALCMILATAVSASVKRGGE
jgi:hypothetical protein